ncbi:MAG: ATP synthase subunit I [Desulfofustis sp.]|nr:ATP synthase subunit I [Desulfofustis sp.]
MNEMTTLVWGLAVVAGMVFGIMFFAGLWWTVRKAVCSERPALWLLGSQFLRTSLALTGFYLVAGGHWQRLLACLLGFAIARFMVTQFTGRLVAPPSHSGKEVLHAIES